MSFETLRLSPEGLELLDQRRLPAEETYLLLKTGEEVACAIEDMVVRGAPAIGVAAAMGVAVELSRLADADLGKGLRDICDRLRRTRPTAVNLAWAVARVERTIGALLDDGTPHGEIRDAAAALGQRLHREDVASCRAIGDHGAALFPDGARVLTHCNAGALATAGYGTALGVIRSAARDGRVERVLASETRPFLQGARLTAWELARDGIPVTLITDGMSGFLMRRGEIDVVVVGADRIAGNGDVANKIGTYMHATLASRHGIPFYVAAPVSTIDAGASSGDEIPIEERSSAEVVSISGVRIAPEGVEALHPAFDVTPAELITAIVTEKGVLRPPFGAAIAGLERD